MNLVVVILAIILLLVVIVFGVSSGMQSNAQAEQARAVAEMARAQAETAQIAQISAWGNVIAILALVTILALCMAAVVLVIYLRYRQTAGKKQGGAVSGPDPMQAIQLALLTKLLQSVDRPQDQPEQRLLEMSDDDQPMHWLR